MNSRAFRNDVRIASILNECTDTQRRKFAETFPDGVKADDTDYAIRILEAMIKKNFDRETEKEYYYIRMTEGIDDERRYFQV